MADRIQIDLPTRFAGLLVVGDVHGHAMLLDVMIGYARRHDLLLVSCGDLVDRGPDSAGCLARMRGLVASAEGLWIRGNHEDKLFRALKGRSVRINEALAATMAELARDETGQAARDWLLETYPSAPFLVRLGQLVVVHGGFGVRMLDLDPLPPPLRARALYGQPSRLRRPDGKPSRLYRWVDEIPADLTVLIGHDPCCADCLLDRRGAQGGRAVHIDSAAGKGGPLSAVETDAKGSITRAWQARPGGSELIDVAILPYAAELARQSDGSNDDSGASDIDV